MRVIYGYVQIGQSGPKGETSDQWPTCNHPWWYRTSVTLWIIDQNRCRTPTPGRLKVLDHAELTLFTQ